jgi:very-short-patch-repair endonuclease/predicted RNA-binding Zn-ribbon protein involved in translation (DUF1610 family)
LPICTDTKPHLKLESLLHELGFKVDKEVGFGGFFVDCYLPDFHVALEADGPFHSIRKDRKRDSFILENYNVPILRFDSKLLMNTVKEKEIKEEILKFVDLYKGSVIERSSNSKLKEFGVVAVKSFFSWRKDKVRKLDPSTGTFYWVAKEYKQFICPTCGINMTVPDTSTRKYCSSKCSNNRPNRIYLPKIVICKYCKKEVKSEDWKVQQYCSHVCYKKANPSWNIGLTTNTSVTLKLMGEKISNIKRGKYKCRECNTYTNTLNYHKICDSCIRR